MTSGPQKSGWFQEYDDPEPPARTSRRPAGARTRQPEGGRTGQPASTRGVRPGRYRLGEDTG